MPSAAAILQEALVRPRWAWHRWRGQREHVLRSGAASHRSRMDAYERACLPLEQAVAKATGATAAQVRAALAPAARPQAPDGAIPPWNDATEQLAAVVRAAIRLRRPRSVVETGVARGVTSAVILQALEETGDGRLLSLDLPSLEPGYREQVGCAVPERLRGRWTLRFGPSAVALPRLLREAAPVDLFLHDSAHTYRNMRLEFERAAQALAPDGLLISDDVCNDSLADFVGEHGWELATVRQDKPPPWTYVGLAWRPRA